MDAVHEDVKNAAARFERGDKVRLVSDAGLTGVVTQGPRRHQSGFEYEVVTVRGESWITEHLLESDSTGMSLRPVTSEELLRELLLAKLHHPLTEALYAYRASRTAYEAYQFRPALKLLGSPHQGLLIADEVGLGKTIEAAIIYLELKARMDISRVLILCPSRLTAKWQDEFRNRFEEDFEILDSTRITRMLKDVRRLGPAVPIRAIGSFELLRRSYVEIAQEQLKLDLLIVDEAHHMRNQSTATYHMGASMVNAADFVLMLSATPLQLHSRDLFSLLNLIAPADFNDASLFEDQLHPNQFISRALRLVAAGSPAHAVRELRQVESTKAAQRFTQNPYYRDILSRLAMMNRSTELSERVDIQRSLMRLNTLDSVMTRTRKREVAHAAVRAAYHYPITLSDKERLFYDSILRQVRDELRSRNMDARGFATIMKERQAASCLPAMQAALRDGMGRRELRLNVDYSQFDLHSPDPEVASERLSNDPGQLNFALSVEFEDTKYKKFVDVLREVLAEDATSKVLVFSFFKRTLGYLNSQLRNEGFRVNVIHGGVRMADRREVIQRFATDPHERVLLSSEVGAEGLDFQFCDVLINYDLPWNPMQVEQRIGRLDRFGQTHDRIRIINFYLEDSIETRIFQRLYHRIGIFERSIGDLEAILGEEIREISRQVIQANLTPNEEIHLAEQAAARIVQRQRAEEELARSEDALLGAGAILDQHVEKTITSGKVISPGEVRALVKTFIRTAFTYARMEEDSDEACWMIELDKQLVKYISDTVETNKSHNRLSDSFKAAMQQKRWVALTFDSEIARAQPNLEFVTIGHPLAEAAIRYWTDSASKGVPAADIAVKELGNETGEGTFSIYVVDLQAVKPRVLLESMVVLNGRIIPDTDGTILHALHEDAAASRVTSEQLAGIELAQRQADSFIAEYRNKVEQKAVKDNEALLAARMSSVTSSFAAQIERTEGYARDASEERIRRMRGSEVQNLRAKRDARLAALQQSKQVIVTSRLIACGNVRIAGEK